MGTYLKSYLTTCVPTQMKQGKSFEKILHRYLYNFYNVANKQQKIRGKKRNI